MKTNITNLALSIIFLASALALMATSCSTVLPEDQYELYQEQIAKLDEAREDYASAVETIGGLQEQIRNLRDELLKPDADETAINAQILELTTDLAAAMTTSVTATATIEDAVARIEAIEEENDVADWMLIGEAVLASIFGVRLTRGPASKGALVKVPFLGNGGDK